MKHLAHHISPVVFALLITGCAYFSIESRDNIREGPNSAQEKGGGPVYNSCVIMGEVESTSEISHPTLIIAEPLSKPEKELTNFVILEKPGPFMLYVPEGEYRIYAVADFNDDAIFQKNEISGVYSRGKEISIESGDVIGNISFHAHTQHQKGAVLRREFEIRDDFSTVTYQGENGKVANIYDEAFSLQNASVGFWAPTRFMRALGANIYLLEEYDPHKIPVLFVHGAEGSPQTWVYFLIRLDRDRYQPWFYYYPSGIRLSLASKLLYMNLTELSKHYPFKRMCITAHSSGGLVTQSLLTRYDLQKADNLAILYITLATPWTGFVSADMSMSFSYKKLPVWLDVASKSPFLKRTLRAELPSNVSHYLFYGKQDTVSEGSALDERVYAGTKGKYGFGYDHNSILSEREVFLKYKDL